MPLISLVAYGLTKMAVGIFAGGIGFGTLSDMRFEIGGAVFNGFWIGSVLVVLLTGRLGGWSELRAVLGCEMVNLWKPTTPVTIENTRPFRYRCSTSCPQACVALLSPVYWRRS
jgi:SSS family solute:Na+ symporter